MTIKLYSHGACKEVTGSKHFLEINGKTLQIDGGMFQGRRDESYEKNQKLSFDPAKVEAILLTHSHFDHCGALPYMVKNGYEGNIYSTAASRDIANIIMLDSAYIQQKDYEYIQKKIKKHPERNLAVHEPLYNSDDVIKTLGQFVTLNYHRKFIPTSGVSAQFFDAGHILGSSCIHLELENGINIGFSGDLGRKGLPIIKDPENMPDLDYLVLESTYGNRLHKSIGLASEDLAEVINTAFLRKGKIVIPAFTVERTQELIYLIHLLVNEGKIPEIPIFIDSPMAVNATSVFKIHPECFDSETIENFTSEKQDPFGFENIHYVTTVSESRNINTVDGPLIIISANGMCEVGRILHHLRNNIENPNNIITIVGYMAENTLGRKLVEGKSEVKIFGVKYKVNADIIKLNSFSGHADYSEIKNWVSKYNLTRLKKIFLVHGEEDSMENLKKELLLIGVKEVQIVEKGIEYELT